MQINPIIASLIGTLFTTFFISPLSAMVTTHDGNRVNIYGRKPFSFSSERKTFTPAQIEDEFSNEDLDNLWQVIRDDLAKPPITIIKATWCDKYDVTKIVKKQMLGTQGLTLELNNNNVKGQGNSWQERLFPKSKKSKKSPKNNLSILW